MPETDAQKIARLQDGMRMCTTKALEAADECLRLTKTIYKLTHRCSRLQTENAKLKEENHSIRKWAEHLL
jgi:hypothetical protein